MFLRSTGRLSSLSPQLKNRSSVEVRYSVLQASLGPPSTEDRLAVLLQGYPESRPIVGESDPNNPLPTAGGTSCGGTVIILLVIQCVKG